MPLTIAYWSPGALHIDPGNPPLTRWIQGIPLLSARPDLGATRADLASITTSWELGYRFEKAHLSDYHALLVRARTASLALLLLTIAGVFAWAHAISGTWAGLAAATLAATCPNLLAHGRLVTPDIGVACAILWSGWAAARTHLAPTWGRAGLVGLFAAAAVLAKFSALAVVPILFAAVLLPAGSTRSRAARAVSFTLAFLTALFTAYGTVTPGTLRGIPLPFPAPMVQGLAAQLAEPAYPAYLFGVVREGGWLIYYGVAFALKTPLPTLALVLLAMVAFARKRLPGGALPLGIALALWVALGFATKKNVGIRYLLPVFPLLYVAFAPLLTWRGRVFGSRAPASFVVGWLLVFVAVVQGVVASAAPLSFFNGVERFFGGKRFALVDSNLDWGQGLPDLRAWMDREEIEVIQLAYFGRIDPSIYGIQWRTPPPGHAVPGPVAISASLAVGRPYVIRWKERPFSDFELAWTDSSSWEWARDLVPDEELAGGSILVWKDAATAKHRRFTASPDSISPP